MGTAKNLGRQLPFIDQDGLVKSTNRGVRVGPYDGSLRWNVQARRERP